MSTATVRGMSEVVYDRRVSPEFLALFDRDDPDGGVASSLVTYANEALFPVDLRFRKDWKSGREHATLYVGLTAVLNVRATRKGMIRLDAHADPHEEWAFRSCLEHAHATG